MTTRKGNLRVWFDLLLFGGLLAALVLGIRYLRGGQTAPLAEASATAAAPGVGTATSAADAPEPAATNPLPPPAATETPLPTEQPTPVAPPELALLLTPYPLRQPAADAAGSIIYLENQADESKTLYSIVTGAAGEMVSNPEKLLRNVTIPKTYHSSSLSPEGQWLALYGDWFALTFLNLDSGEYHHFAPYEMVFQDWFPNGEMALVVSSSRHLMAMDLATGNIIPLVDVQLGAITGGIVSPDGTKVVYIHAMGNSPVVKDSVWALNIENKQKYLILEKRISFDSWSPDGLKIAFQSESVWEVMNDQGNVFLTIDAFQPSGCYASEPRWSPDSRYFVLTIVSACAERFNGWILPEAQNAYIFLVDSETGEYRPLVAEGVKDYFDPTWSPDGRQIAFVSFQSGASEIWAVNVDGSNLRQMTFTGTPKRFPIWRWP